VNAGVGAGRHLIAFVKAPRLGTVKTRLAADLGALAALRFYRATSGRLLRRLGRDPRWTLWLAVTPDRLAHAARLWPAGARAFPQGGGDLGARMTRALRRVPPGPAIIVGSDVPEITPVLIARGFAALARHDAVLGPALDGGYWLVGLSARARGLDPFAGVRWSSPHALVDTLANFAPARRVALIDPLDDIDTIADYDRWRERVSPGPR